MMLADAEKTAAKERKREQVASAKESPGGASSVPS